MNTRTNPATLLREMVEIPSPSGEEQELAQYLLQQMARMGFDARLDEVGNAIGELGTGPRTIVLLGHMDTVSGLVPVREGDGMLFGRGSVDAKGALATFICAAARVGPPDNTRLVVIGAVEEEAFSRGAHHVRHFYKPDLAIIGEPSGWESITLGYKGSLTLKYQLDTDNGHTAGASIGAPETAISFWNGLCDICNDFNNGKTRMFDILTPRLVSINSCNDGITDRVEMRVNIRWPLDLDFPAFRQKMLELTGPTTLEFLSCEVPHRSDKSTPLTGALLRSIRERGGHPRFKLKTGTSDMNVVGPAWGCPIVAYGPGNSGLDHTPHEHISLREYHQAIEVLVGVLKRV